MAVAHLVEKTPAKWIEAQRMPQDILQKTL
jgi:hypothetical protein